MPRRFVGAPPNSEGFSLPRAKIASAAKLPTTSANIIALAQTGPRFRRSLAIKQVLAEGRPALVICIVDATVAFKTACVRNPFGASQCATWMVEPQWPASIHARVPYV